MRWWKELRDPALKCERVGHKYKDSTRRIRREVHEHRIVCRDYEQQIRTCSRCGHRMILGEKEVDWYTGVTMPQSMWDEIRSKGYVVIR